MTNKVVLISMPLLFALPAARADHPLGGFGLGAAGPITAGSASTLPRGKGAVSLQFEYIRNNALSDAQLLAAAAGGNDDVHSLKSIFSPSLRLAYGVTDDFSLGLRLPYVKRSDIREAHLHEDEGEIELHTLGTSEGIGDLVLLGQYRFLNDRERRLEAALVAGVKAPTGKTNRIDDQGVAFEAHFQPGSGSWDGVLGAALTKRAGPYSWDGNVVYTFAGNGTQDTNLGDRFQYNLALSYRLGQGTHEPHEHAADSAAPHHHVAWDLMLELNGEWQEKQEIAGVSDPNSGGNVVYLSPGLRVSVDDWAAFVSVGKPIVRNLNGLQSEPDYRVVAGVSLGF
jgi:hypothetical protein